MQLKHRKVLTSGQFHKSNSSNYAMNNKSGSNSPVMNKRKTQQNISNNNNNNNLSDNNNQYADQSPPFKGASSKIVGMNRLRMKPGMHPS